MGALGMAQVLVVEDSDEIREALCDLLASEWYHPIGCQSGEAAWTQLAAGLRPAVMIVDLALGGMSGRELLSRLRGTDWGRSIPVLLLSGWDRPERFADQADAVLGKEAESVSIMRAVDRLAVRGRSMRSGETAPSERRPPHRADAGQAQDPRRTVRGIAKGR